MFDENKIEKKHTHTHTYTHENPFFPVDLCINRLNWPNVCQIVLFLFGISSNWWEASLNFYKSFFFHMVTIGILLQSLHVVNMPDNPSKLISTKKKFIIPSQLFDYSKIGRSISSIHCFQHWSSFTHIDHIWIGTNATDCRFYEESKKLHLISSWKL